MKVIEFHPDHLLDRELRGTLTAEEGRLLSEHLASCHACRLERQLRRDFEQELGRVAGSRDVDRVVAAALQSMAPEQEPAPKPEPPSSAHGLRRPGRRLQFAALLVATFVLGTGLAMGQRGWTGRALRALDDAFGSVWRGRSEGPVRSHPARAGAPASPIPAPAAQPKQLATTDEAITPVAPPARSPDAVANARRQTRRLFEHANSARRQRSLAKAGVLYRRLQSRFPHSPEARLSLVLSARMWLDAGDNGAALSGFEAYLATSEQSLREEAMAGRALALQRLGRTRASERALDQLQQRYPHSAHAASLRRGARQKEP